MPTKRRVDGRRIVALAVDANDDEVNARAFRYRKRHV
jgi:hypothetical protein